MIIEKDAWTMNGYLATIIAVLFFLCSVYSAYHSEFVFTSLYLITGLCIVSGLTRNETGYAKVIFSAGKYVGVIRQAGLMMTIPFSRKKQLSLKICTNHYETTITTGNSKQKVSITIVYKVVDSAKAMIMVEQMETYVQAQTAIYFCQYFQMVEKEAFPVENRQTLQKKLDIAGIEIMDIAYSTCPGL